MISFIIIGKNEGWKLSKCFESVFKTIKFNGILHYEVIYVDSNSTDDSIKRAKEYNNIKIFQIISKPNAAIARNIGANESKGDVLFFIDGDMEILEEFLKGIYSEQDGLIYEFISGQFVNYFYDNNNDFIQKENYYKPNETIDQFQTITGGIFLIMRSTWELVNGMKNKYKRSQDIDLGLRLAKKRIKLLRKKEVIAIHHTVSYREKSRMWKMLLDNTDLFSNSMLIRDHLFNKSFYPRFLRSNYSLVILILTVCLMCFYCSIYPMFLYLTVILFRSLFVARKTPIRLLEYFIYFFIRDVRVLLGLFLFFPSNNLKVEYREL